MRSSAACSIGASSASPAFVSASFALSSAPDRGRPDLAADTPIPEPGRAAAAAPERSQPEAARDEHQDASHRSDATLAPLLATPVAPSTRSGVNGAGPTQSMGSHEFGRSIRTMNEYEILLHARPRARRGAGKRDRPARPRARRGRRRDAGTATSRGAGASSPTRSTTSPRASTTCCSSRVCRRRCARSRASSRSPTASSGTWLSSASRRGHTKAPAPMPAAVSPRRADDAGEAAE